MQPWRNAGLEARSLGLLENVLSDVSGLDRGLADAPIAVLAPAAINFLRLSYQYILDKTAPVCFYLRSSGQFHQHKFRVRPEKER
jgi:hypothetical protein